MSAKETGEHIGARQNHPIERLRDRFYLERQLLRDSIWLSVRRYKTNKSPSFLWEVRGQTLKSIENINGRLPLSHLQVNVDICPISEENKHIQYANGRANAKNRLITVSLHSKLDYPDRETIQEIEWALAHEWIHIARAEKTGIIEGTLLDSFVDEALAMKFSEKVSGSCGLPPDLQLINKEEVEKWSTIAISEFNVGCSYVNWFGWGYRSKMPPRVGYAISYAMMNKFEDKNPSISIEDLINEPSETFTDYF
jgi:uncharacterized protein YjaZ